MWPLDPDEFESRLAPPEKGGDAPPDWYFVFIEGQLACVSEQGRPSIIDADAYRWLDVERHSEHYLGEFEGRSCYAVEAQGNLGDGYAVTDLRGVLGRLPPSLFYLAGRAKQIIDWHQTHQFCGRCGTATDTHPDERSKLCDACGLIAYPRLSPSIIVLITKGDEMLLARNAAWPTGFYSTLAGFVEPGESVEQTLHREVEEEVGLKVANLRYFGSQSWPFPNSLMLGYHAEYAGGEIVCQDGEIADAQWFSRDNLPNMPPKTAISRWLIDAFIESGA